MVLVLKIFFNRNPWHQFLYSLYIFNTLPWKDKNKKPRVILMIFWHKNWEHHLFHWQREVNQQNLSNILYKRDVSWGLEQLYHGLPHLGKHLDLQVCH